MKNIKSTLNNLVFKVFIGFLVLSFVFFGVSSFLLGGSSSWIAKVGGDKITLNDLQRSKEINKNLLLRSNPNNPKALEYINSSRYSIDILKKLINQTMVSKVGEKYGIKGDRKLILQAVAKDPAFIKNGKFDRNYFRYFLSQNGLDEQSYIELVQDEIINVMVTNSISLTSPIDLVTSQKIADIKKEKRYADIIRITKNNISRIKAPKEAELKAIYEENKENFTVAETRKTSYISFSRDNLLKDITISEKEIKKYYNDNKSNYASEEKRDFYHISFKEEEKATKFHDSLKNSPNKIQKFINLAKKEKKSLGSIKLNDITKNDMLKDLADKSFALKKNEVSDIIKSDLGFHIFLVKDIKGSDYIPYKTVRNDIKKQLLSKKSEDKIQEGIAEIENFLISSNSLQETSNKFKLGQVRKLKAINKEYKNKLENYANNAFLTKENRTSPIYISKDRFYALKVNKVNQSYYKSFAQTKNLLKKFYYDKERNIKLKELARKISNEIQENPKNARKIAQKNGLSFTSYKRIDSSSEIEISGRKIPFTSKFQEEIFSLKENQSTSYHQTKKDEYQIGILRKIKKNKATSKEVKSYQKELANLYRNEFLEEFNKYLQKEFEIQVNEKFLQSLQAE